MVRKHLKKMVVVLLVCVGTYFLGFYVHSSTTSHRHIPASFFIHTLKSSGPSGGIDVTRRIQIKGDYGILLDPEVHDVKIESFDADAFTNTTKTPVNETIKPDIDKNKSQNHEKERIEEYEHKHGNEPVKQKINEQKTKPPETEQTNTKNNEKKADIIEKEHAQPKPSGEQFETSKTEQAHPKVDEKQPEVKPNPNEKQAGVKPNADEKQPEVKPNPNEKQAGVKPNADEKQPEVKPNTDEKQPKLKPNADEKHPEVKPNAYEKQPEIKLNADEKQPEIKPNADEKQPEIKPNAHEKQPEIKPNAHEKQPEIKPNADEKQPEVKPNAHEKQPEIKRNAYEKQPEIKPNADEKHPEVKPNADEKQPQIKPNADEKHPEVKPNADEKQPQIKPNADEKQPEVKPNADEKKPEVKPNADEKKPEVKPNADEKKPEVKPNADEKPPEVKPNAHEKKPEVKPNADEKQPEIIPNADEKQPKDHHRDEEKSKVHEKQPETHDKEQVKPKVDERQPNERNKDPVEQEADKKSKPPQKEHIKSEVNRTSKPKPIVESFTFQAVDGDSLFVYSAFWDMDSHIRVFALTKLVRNNIPIKCQIWVHNPPKPDEKPTTVDGKIVVIPDHHSLKFTAGYVICRLPPEVKHSNPTLVTLFFATSAKNSSTSPTTSNVTLAIHKQQSWKSEFTVCTPPVFNNYNSVDKVIEMVEFNRILGSTKFFFYNYSIGPDVSELLNHYKRQGIVEIIAWPLPTNALKSKGRLDVHYYGQLAAMNDCVYRNRHQSQYVVLVDMDEFIIPNITTNMTTWRELIAHRKSIAPKATVFWIKNIFFRLKWTKQEDTVSFYLKDEAPHKFTSTVLSCRYREHVFFDYGIRSKNILDPLGVRIVGIHSIWEVGGPRDLVPESDASMHHYRSRYWPGDRSVHIFDDTVVKRYGPRFIKAVHTAWNEYRNLKDNLIYI